VIPREMRNYSNSWVNLYLRIIILNKGIQRIIMTKAGPFGFREIEDQIRHV
jgi:hypothetical protein